MPMRRVASQGETRPATAGASTRRTAQPTPSTSSHRRRAVRGGALDPTSTDGEQRLAERRPDDALEPLRRGHHEAVVETYRARVSRRPPKQLHAHEPGEEA